MAPTPTCDLIEKKAASKICYKIDLCYIYSKQKKTLSLCSAWEILLPSLEIPCPLALCLWLLGIFKYTLLKTLCLVKTQCYITYPVYVVACKKSAQDLILACKLYILSFVLCLMSIYLT